MARPHGALHLAAALLLLTADFDQWYPGNEDRFENKFPILKKKLTTLFETVSNKSQFVKELKDLLNKLLFPTEDCSIYYTKPSEGPGRAHGRLYDAVTNLKAKFRRNKVYQPRAKRNLDKTLTPGPQSKKSTNKRIVLLSEEDSALTLDTAEVDECLEWLHCSADNLALCNEKWSKTRKRRQQRVISEETHTYLLEFPCLTRSWGYSLVRFASAQDYDVTDIQCTFATGGSGLRDSVSALLRKPEGFKGSPLFADDRTTRPDNDPVCQIRPEPEDPTGLLYRLRISDFSRCGVLKRNGFVHVRIWFPQFPGVVMQSDQELIIMCKPPEPTVIENKAAGFAGSFPHGARVSGVVEETPGRLEYEVALYKEAPPVSRHVNHSLDMPVDQAVPIGTKLQLRARINPDSAWRHVKLLEVAVSPDPDRPHAPGAVLLVKDGCRNRDFASIIPHQPARYRERHNEVFLDFEAFLLASMKERSTLWIHSQIKACMDAADCQPDYCLDMFEPSVGHGRRRRAVSSGNETMTTTLAAAHNDTNPFTRFKENLEYTVVMPGELFHRSAPELTCATPILVAAALGGLLFMSGLLMCYLATRLNSTLLKNNRMQASGKSFEHILREIARHSFSDTGYTGRPTVQ